MSISKRQPHKLIPKHKSEHKSGVKATPTKPPAKK
jgi:hypothetical protein